MAASEGWEAAFVAMSVALGMSVETACGALGDEARAAVTVYAATLQSPVKETRAKALAAGLTRIAVAIEASRLA
jgi:hypothetical protein